MLDGLLQTFLRDFFAEIADRHRHRAARAFVIPERFRRNLGRLGVRAPGELDGDDAVAHFTYLANANVVAARAGHRLFEGTTILFQILIAQHSPTSVPGGTYLPALYALRQRRLYSDSACRRSCRGSSGGRAGD